MSSSADQVTQWLDEGLRHYGLGDPAKALDVWLRVLEAEPGNSRAKEYVEIVRSTYGEEAVAAATVGDDEKTEVNPIASALPAANASDETHEINGAAGASASTDAANVDAVVTAPVVTAPVVTAPVVTAPVVTAPVVDVAPEKTDTARAVTVRLQAPAESPEALPVKAQDPNPDAVSATTFDDDTEIGAPTTVGTQPAIDPLDSVAGPNWADMAADADVASAAFDTPSVEAATPVLGAETAASIEDVPATPAEPAAPTSATAPTSDSSYSVSSNQLTAKTIEIEDSILAAAKSTPEGRVPEDSAPSGGVTSGAAGPVVVDVSDDEPDEPEEAPKKSTSASVRIGRKAPIEESVSNVVHSIRYGESFDDGSGPSPRAGPFFTAIKEKAREESSTIEIPKMTDSLEFNRSEIRTTAAPLPVRDPLAKTVEIKSDELVAAQEGAESPPPSPPVETPLVEALDGANTVEIDRNAISQAATVEIPLPSVIAATAPSLPSPTVGASQSLSAGGNRVQTEVATASAAVTTVSTPTASEPVTTTPAAPPSAAPPSGVQASAAPATEASASAAEAPAQAAEPPVDIFAPTPVANVPAPQAASLFSDLPPTLVSSESEELADSAVRDAQQAAGPGAASMNLQDALQNPWGEEGVPSTDLDVDPAAPSMFDLLLSASDRANQAKPMDVAVQAHKPKPEDGRRGASQDMAPLSSASAFAHTPNTDPEPDEDSSEKHESDVLMDGAKELFALGDFSGSLELVEKVLELAPDHPEAKKYFKQNSSTLLKMYESKLGNLESTPRQLTSPDEVIWMNMHHRAGFVLSQVDGMLTYEEIADVSGLPRLETFRILAELAQNGVIG